MSVFKSKTGRFVAINVSFSVSLEMRLLHFYLLELWTERGLAVVHRKDIYIVSQCLATTPFFILSNAYYDYKFLSVWKIILPLLAFFSKYNSFATD